MTSTLEIFLRFKFCFGQAFEPVMLDEHPSWPQRSLLVQSLALAAPLLELCFLEGVAIPLTSGQNANVPSRAAAMGTDWRVCKESLEELGPFWSRHYTEVSILCYIKLRAACDCEAFYAISNYELLVTRGILCYIKLRAACNGERANNCPYPDRLIPEEGSAQASPSL